jgi:SAM-dependent methyltransferase
MTSFDESYWNERYRDNKTGWDIGYPSPALIEFAESLGDKSLRILIPGAGNAYEAEYLFKAGFQNTAVLDLSKDPLNALKSRVPEFPEEQLIHGDFFDHKGQYDLILEQTFFCALDPKMRSDYASKMKELLAPNGVLSGLLFNFPLTEKGPPFGGSESEYRTRLSEHLEVEKLEPCPNSIKPRLGSEFFFVARKLD